MNISLKIISLLLSYPTAELQQDAPELKAALETDPLTSAREKALLAKLADDIAGLDLYDAQERYVFLFDRTRTLSLHLFEHVHGESRDRGQAMVDLMAMYNRHGFEIGAKELPDYLPLFLEFLSAVPDEQARELLGQTVHIVSALRERLRKRKSIYGNAFRVLEAIARGKADPAVLAELLNEEDDDPNDLDALDKVWEEEAVTFGGGPGNNPCGVDRIRTQIRAGQRRPDARPTTDTIKA
jgi:nitrate reductase delta subunit